MPRSKYSDTEVELIKIKLENKLIKEGLVYPDDFDKTCLHLNKNAKEKVRKELASEDYIEIDEEGIFKYSPKEYKSIYDKKKILRDILKLSHVKTTKDYVLAEDVYYKGIICTKFPYSPKTDWLLKVVTEKTNVDYVLITNIKDLSELREFLRQQLRKIENQLYKYEKGGRANPELERKRKEVSELIYTIGREYTEFRASLFLIVKGKTLDEVESLKSSMISLLKGEDLIAEEAAYLHEYVLKLVIPTGENKLCKQELLITDKDIQEGFPYFHPWQDIEEDDETILGFNESGLVVTGNIWKSKSGYSGIYLGQTGSGKSLGCKYELIQQMIVSGAQVIVIDPAAAKLKDQPTEYERMCKLLGGKYVSFDPDEENFPNPLSTFPGTKFDDEMRRVYSVTRVLFEDEEKHVPEPQKPLIMTGVVEAFRRRGITRKTKEFWKRKQPKMEDLLFVFRKGLSRAKTEGTRMSYEALIKRLEPCVGGGLRSYLNTDAREVDVDKSFTVFAFKDTPEDDKPLLITRMLSYISKVALESLRRTIIVLEEAYWWLSDPYLSLYLAKTETTVRKTNTGLRLIFQDLGQLEGCKEGLTLLGNLSFVYLMRTASNLIPLTKKTFNLNDTECDVLETSEAGDFVILIQENKHYKVKINVPPDIYKVITTNPDELKAIEKEEEKKKYELGTKELLKEDLGYEPMTIESGLIDLAKKIKNKPHIEEIIEHYPQSIAKQLKKLIKGKKVIKKKRKK